MDSRATLPSLGAARQARDATRPAQARIARRHPQNADLPLVTLAAGGLYERSRRGGHLAPSPGTSC
ncbi:MAG: hypothetical protein ACK53L_30125, partial [Pirellulaceae bacterium]